MNKGIKRVTLMVLTLGLVVSGQVSVQASSLPPQRRVNVPYFAGSIDYSQTAIFWFGDVTLTNNYADVRLGYNNDRLFMSVTVLDRLIWYDPNPSPANLTKYDSLTLFLNTNGNSGNSPSTQAYQLVSQLEDSADEPHDSWQAAYRGNGSGWITATVPFTITSFNQWESGDVGGFNNNEPNRGWVMNYSVPFVSLGLSGPPPQGTQWGLGIALHDRDDQVGSPIADQVWPTSLNGSVPSTWGQLHFGIPHYSLPPAVSTGVVTVRNKLNGAVVVDAAVGGGTVCGSPLNYWTQWPITPHPGERIFNVQNQLNVADWPCFSKAFVTFPLNRVPQNKVIISATLTLYQFGNAGQGWTPPPEPSFIQVLTVDQDWNESTLTWNNAPQARENIAGTWVDPLETYPGYPGVPRTWNVDRAVAEAYAAGQPLRLAVYSADGAYHSGRYFYSSDLEDEGAAGRPTLTITWGEAMAAIHKTVWPPASSQGKQVTYTLSFLGSGRALTLADNLPAQVSVAGPIHVIGGGNVVYDAAAHRVMWTGSAAIGQAISLTFPVTVLVSNPMAIYNSAVLTDAVAGVTTSSALFIANGYEAHLPIVRK